MTEGSTATSTDETRIPLFPLPNVVHFPHTELRLQVAGAQLRRLIRDVLDQDEGARRIGVVLLKPGAHQDLRGRPEVFAGGTAGLLTEHEVGPHGRDLILLHGEFRFEVRRELDDAPYRQAVVRPVEEPWLDETDAGIVAARRAIVELLRLLAAELGERFPFSAGVIDELAEGCRFEEVVNRVAADLDVPLLRKQQLLHEALPERGLSVLSILRSRQQVVDLLRPFRHLAAASPLN